jgi:hypothetical protein
MDQNGIRITTTPSFSLLHSYSFTTALTGTNLIGMVAQESGASPRILGLVNSTTQASQLIQTQLMAAGASTQAILSVNNNETGSGSPTGPYISVGADFLPATDNVVSCGNASFRWLKVSTVDMDVTGLPKFRGTNSTGAGGTAWGANCPAVNAANPYTWISAISADGSAVFIPCWK